VEKINIYASILGQILTLIFAIFVGYFAFLQVVEGRLDKLEERAYFELKQRSYRRATQYYEEAYIINPKDSSVLSNLLELYLILEDYNNFDEKINQLQRISIEEKEKVALLYLQVAEFLLKQHLHEAKEEIKKLVQFIEKHPMALNHFNWNFSDIQDSEVYKRINGESKTIFDNLIKYVSRKLSNEQKNNFEKGNYSTPVEKS
jgi:tetratricopeptide (TPR) repeat protein